MSSSLIQVVNADLAHLVERHLAKVEVAGSSPVIRLSRFGNNLIVRNPEQCVPDFSFIRKFHSKKTDGLYFSPSVRFNIQRSL